MMYGQQNVKKNHFLVEV